MVRSTLHKFEHVWRGGPVQIGPSRACHRGQGPGQEEQGWNHVQRGRGVVWKAGLGPCTGTPPWTGQTDTTENITFTTPLAGGDEIGLVQRASTTNCKYTIKRV